MKLIIDLEETWSCEESIAEAIKFEINEAVQKEIRKIVKETITENKSAIIALASAHAKKLIQEAERMLK